jgi:hypothetical protein
MTIEHLIIEARDSTPSPWNGEGAVQEWRKLSWPITTAQRQQLALWNEKRTADAWDWYRTNGSDAEHIGGVCPESPLFLVSHDAGGPSVSAYYSLHAPGWTPEVFVSEVTVRAEGPLDADPFVIQMLARVEDVRTLQAWVAETPGVRFAFGGKSGSMGSDLYAQAFDVGDRLVRMLHIDEFDGDYCVTRDADFESILKWWKR